MERRRGRERGGIARVRWLIDNHRGAFEAELIRTGLRLRDLGTAGFTWHDAAVLVEHLPHDSPMRRQIWPQDWEDASWGAGEHLLAAIADGVHWLVWALSLDGQKGRNPPEPVARPGERANPGPRRGMSVEELERRLAADRARDREKHTPRREEGSG